MKTLAFDCASKTVSAALCADGKPLAQRFLNEGLTHSETLLPMIAYVLGGEKPGEVVVTRGPGSFTGLRIGLAAALGLSAAWGVPCLGASSLEAAAWGVCDLSGDRVICAVMDARRGQVYNALFMARNGVIARLCGDRAVSSAEVLAEIGEKPVILVGDGAEMCYNIWERENFTLAPPELRCPTGYGVARCERTSPEPVYLRMPQAERERLKREEVAHNE
ncbi:tRNA (adenosine(37)-N6)-threonylcarbamoyltransferase complex dimerization subunit type 1 TsaB [Clostridia bacterium]|nr:tRNA (adenosine(37)-N6)-threonylcarbamoyltransferase complex dimerization subunit type 1 TsaB [Clostridia bacterium]